MKAKREQRGRSSLKERIEEAVAALPLVILLLLPLWWWSCVGGCLSCRRTWRGRRLSWRRAKRSGGRWRRSGATPSPHNNKPSHNWRWTSTHSNNNSLSEEPTHHHNLLSPHSSTPATSPQPHPLLLLLLSFLLLPLLLLLLLLLLLRPPLLHPFLPLSFSVVPAPLCCPLSLVRGIDSVCGWKWQRRPRRRLRWPRWN